VTSTPPLGTTGAFQPCTLTISGSNTANSPTTLIAFSYLGGLVYQSDGTGTTGFVVSDAPAFGVNWTFTDTTFIGATSPTDGSDSPITQGNTYKITQDPTCTGSLPLAQNCAAARCLMVSTSLYLPAINELSNIYSALCSNGQVPCNFGGFLAQNYWSSTELSSSQADGVDFSIAGGPTTPLFKNATAQLRCVRAFP
jgi:hypothetical protein